MIAEFSLPDTYSPAFRLCKAEVSEEKPLFWHKNTRLIAFSRIHHGSLCFATVPANALGYVTASCFAFSPPLDGNIFSGSHTRVTPIILRARMTKTREPKPSKSSPAANDNASDGSISLSLHKFVLLLGKLSDRKIMKHLFPEKPANDNTLESKPLADEDLEKGTDNTRR